MHQGNIYKQISIVILILTSLLWSCAQFGVPQGGDKDEDAPFLIREGSTKNQQVNFNERKITLEFNEWIKVSNSAKEVFVSPPLAYPPKVLERGKKVVFEFSEDEVLKDSTTYQINFGKSIKDLTEGNVFENYTFIFSTGDKIDSLRITGKVIDTKTDQGIGDVVVLLYDNLSDTSFYTTKPFYLTRTDKTGTFELQNLRSDTFQIFALKDDNVSYTYDLSTELVAYRDSFLLLQDSSIADIELLLFDEEDDPRLVETSQKKTGLIKLTYIPMPFNPKLIKLETDSINQFLEIKEDTLLIWHDGVEYDSLQFAIQHEKSIDTIKVKPGRKSIVENNLKAITERIEILKKDSIKIDFNLPISKLDTSKIILRDTGNIVIDTELGIYEKSIWCKAAFVSDQEYFLTLDSFSVVNWYDKSFKDSISIPIKVTDQETLGNIEIDLIHADSIQYIVSLMKGKKVIKKLYVLESEKIKLENLESGSYKINIIQDLNRDQRWTTGSIKERRRSEIIKELTLEELKAGWDLQAIVDFQEIFYGTEIN